MNRLWGYLTVAMASGTPKNLLIISQDRGYHETLPLIDRPIT
jgi:hypothetical protein